MADREPDPDTEADEAEEETAAVINRDQDLLGRKRRGSSPLRRKLSDTFQDIHKGFTDQVDRTDHQMDWWDCYDCVLNDNQWYNGNAQIYVPIIRDAVNARATRFVNQLFPPGGRYVDAISTDGSVAHDEIAIVEYYIRRLLMKNQVLRPLCIAGDIEGQYNLVLGWENIRRQIVSRETHGPVDPESGEELGGEEIEDIKVEDILEGGPTAELIHDSDVLILPSSARSPEHAVEAGGCVAIVRRWTKAKLLQMVDDGAILEAEADDLLNQMNAAAQSSGDNVPRDAEKRLREHVGIRARGAHVVVWEVWKKLPLSHRGAYSEDGTPRICRLFMSAGGGGEMMLGAKRNPFWNDRVPVLSFPVVKVGGSAKGQSLVEPLAPLQYEANDAANEGADAATYAAAPIVARDPNNTTANLIFNMGAIWDVNPKDLQFMQFPDLTPRAMTRIGYCTTAIFQALGVNPSMLPQQTQQGKRNQAQVAQEQMVDLLTTAEATSVLSEGILTPMIEWFVDLDHQYRDDDLTIRMFGREGVEAKMEKVEPLRNRRAIEFTWIGAEAARNNAAMMQQGTALINVARGMQQQLQAEGMMLRIGPVLAQAFENVFGARLARNTLVDMREQFSMQPDQENELLLMGEDLYVSPLDNDVKHLQSHQSAMSQSGDPHGTFRVHVQRHLQSMQLKQQSAAHQQLAQQGAQGVPGGAGPGVAGTPRGGMPPRIGAQPAGPRLIKGPVGGIAPDQMPRAGAPVPPRRA